MTETRPSSCVSTRTDAFRSFRSASVCLTLLNRYRVTIQRGYVKAGRTGRPVSVCSRAESTSIRCFRSVERDLRIRQNMVMPCSPRKQHETFCWTLIIRTSRSAWLLDEAVNDTISLSSGGKSTHWTKTPMGQPPCLLAQGCQTCPFSGGTTRTQVPSRGNAPVVSRGRRGSPMALSARHIRSHGQRASHLHQCHC